MTAELIRHARLLILLAALATLSACDGHLPTEPESTPTATPTPTALPTATPSPPPGTATAAPPTPAPSPTPSPTPITCWVVCWCTERSHSWFPSCEDPAATYGTTVTGEMDEFGRYWHGRGVYDFYHYQGLYYFEFFVEFAGHTERITAVRYLVWGGPFGELQQECNAAPAGTTRQSCPSERESGTDSINGERRTAMEPDEQRELPPGAQQFQQQEPLETFEAWFDIDRIAGSKRFQGCWLRLDDGARLVIGYRAVPEYFGFVDRRVKVTGRRYTNPPTVQQIGAQHFQLHSIELAPGEQPAVPLPSTLPAPPMVNSAAELLQRDGRWVQLVGTLRSAELRPEDEWGDAVVVLADGTRILVPDIYTSSLNQRWRPLIGNTVTVTGLLEKVTGQEPPFILTGQRAICPGKTDRCGMDGTR